MNQITFVGGMLDGLVRPFEPEHNFAVYERDGVIEIYRLAGSEMRLNNVQPRDGKLAPVCPI